MADNIEVAGKTIATDEISSVHYQRAKLIHGADGTNAGDVALTNPLPVDAMLNTGVIQSSGSQLTPKFAVINLAATGTLVAAVTGKRIRVLSLLMTIDVLTGDETYTFKSGGGGTALTGDLGEASAAAAVLVVQYNFSPLGHFQTASGSLLELSLGVAAEAQGSLCYVEV
ncbi:hypothetical protein LCGC14_0589740 [marine sediment metagenome]|uniref:Major tropism determinant N-terminal domain-containing protein n=1 Tax=marine sediment metagenome TaxID=412755 RepID=A0A0F9RDT9_9ZZZZ